MNIGTTPGPAAPASVLVVEDDRLLAQLVVKYLQREGFDVEHSDNGSDGVAAARRLDPDVVILDLGLPGIDGLEVCRRLRQFSDCYVIMLTARDDEIDKLVGLTVGADDYLTKPFSHRELVARVRVMLRRPRRPAAAGSEHPDTWTFGALQVVPAAREALLEGRPVALTPTEFDLLVTLASHPRVVLSRRQLVEAVWGPAWVGDERMIDVHIRNLRRKLGDDAARPRFIRTVRGAGYRIGDGR